MRRFLLALVLALLATNISAQQIKVPFNPANKEVTDLAGVLNPSQKADLTSRIRELERTDGTQLAILTISTLRGDDIFNFAQRTAKEWGLGQADKDNGALFVLVTQDKQARIQVGYGLEGSLPDALAKRILSTEATPLFKQGKYYEGLLQGTDSIIKAVRGEYKAPPQQAQKGRGGSGMSGIMVILFIMFMLWQMKRGGRGGPGGRGGRGFGGPGVVLLPDIWSAGRGGSWGGGGDGGGFGGGGFGGGDFGGGGAGDSW